MKQAPYTLSHLTGRRIVKYIYLFVYLFVYLCIYLFVCVCVHKLHDMNVEDRELLVEVGSVLAGGSLRWCSGHQATATLTH